MEGSSSSPNLLWEPEIPIPVPAKPAAAQSIKKAAAGLSRSLASTAAAPLNDDAGGPGRKGRAAEKTGWFDMKAPVITDEVKRDFRLLRLRSTFDTKRHYKSIGVTKIPKHFQMGTVVEGAGEFYSGRLTKRERKQTFAEEILADVKVKQDRKRRYQQMQETQQYFAQKRKAMRANHKRSSHRPKH